MEQDGQTPPQQFETPGFTPRPQQMMSFMDALTVVFRNKFGDFNGRASRSEYWWGYLGYFLITNVFLIGAMIFSFALSMVSPEAGFVVLFLPLLAFLVFVIPLLSSSVRRLHDTGKSGWMILITFIPCIGLIMWLVWMIEEGQAHDNAYGPVPTNTL